eukprot:gene6626-17476_t
MCDPMRTCFAFVGDAAGDVSDAASQPTKPTTLRRPRTLPNSAAPANKEMGWRRARAVSVRR